MRCFDFQRRPQHAQRYLLHLEAGPRPDQAGGEIMWQASRTRHSGRLHVELLQHLDRKRPVILVQQRIGPRPFGGFVRVRTDRVKQPELRV